MKTILKLSLMSVAYLATFIIGAASGMIHPCCFVYSGALLPLLTAFVYLNTCSAHRSFGAATLLNGVVLLLFILAGEADTACIVGMICLTLIAELLRYSYKYDTKKGVRASFIPFAFSYFPYVLHWWSDTEGSLAAAVEEMPEGYDVVMKTVIDNVPGLVIILILTVPVAIVAMKLAENTLKKQAANLL